MSFSIGSCSFNLGGNFLPDSVFSLVYSTCRKIDIPMQFRSIFGSAVIVHSSIVAASPLPSSEHPSCRHSLDQPSAERNLHLSPMALQPLFHPVILPLQRWQHFIHLTGRLFIRTRKKRNLYLTFSTVTDKSSIVNPLNSTLMMGILTCVPCTVFSVSISRRCCSKWAQRIVTTKLRWKIS